MALDYLERRVETLEYTVQTLHEIIEGLIDELGPLGGENLERSRWRDIYKLLRCIAGEDETT